MPGSGFPPARERQSGGNDNPAVATCSFQFFDGIDSMNLYLIGFRGCGKSTVGPLLAKTIGWQSVDSDEQIMILTGSSIFDIFADAGEGGFRQWETTVIQALAQTTEHVVSVGGGAPMVADNQAAIKRSGRAVLLTAPAELLWQRIESDPKSKLQRPGLTDLDGIAEVQKLLALRAEAYNECADYTIDVSELNPREVADKIADWWDPVDN